MDTTFEIIENIISQKDLSKFIGLKEGLHFDAKDKASYDINSPANKYEIAKDVSSFANAEGGYIIIGLETEALLEENTEKVKNLQLFNQADFSIDAWLPIINSYIHPQIDNLKIKYIKDVNNSELVLVSICVPKQDDVKKYFLIKNICEEGNNLKQIVFGVAVREKSHTVIKTVRQLYQIIRNGKGPIEEKLARIENKLDLIVETTIIPQGYSMETLDERIHKIEEW